MTAMKLVQLMHDLRKMYDAVSVLMLQNNI